MKLILLFSIFLLCLITLSNGYQPSLEGEAYQSRSAASKLKILLANLQENTTPASFYTVSSAELFTEDLNLSFDSFSDDMPSQGLLSSKRKKLIHSVGAVAQARYTSNGQHNYTGIFQGGCDNVLIRISLATKPDDGRSPNIVPGMAVKFLRDGMPSDNVFAMYSLTGQKSFNIFQHDWSSHVPALNPKEAPLPQRLLNNRFATVTDFPTVLGLSPLAQYSQNGTLCRRPNFPFRLQFHPVTPVHSKFPSAPQSGDKYFLSQLESLQPGPIFQVYAQATPFNDKLTLIGQLSLTSSPISSHYGDKSLFYQHTFFDRDLVFHPEWRNATLNIIQRESTTVGGFTFPDLPW